MNTIQDLALTVAVVCFNEGKNISACLGSLLKQDTDIKYEIIAVDNNSDDSTPQILKECAESNKKIRVFNNPIRKISKSRSIALQEAKGKFIAFVDADCIVPCGWLKVLVDGYNKYEKIYPDLAAAGGANIFPEERNRFQEAAAIVLSSFWGSHTSVQGRAYKEDRLVKHIPTVNILYNKQVLLEAGGFDEEFGSICEDVELNHRLIKRGYKIIFLKDSFVWHNFASGLKEWAQKVFTYGKGRVWVIKKHPGHFNLKFIIPPMLVASLPLALVLGSSSRAFLIPLLYFPFIFLASLTNCLKNRKITLVPWVFLIYITTHFAYGLGEYYGLFRQRR